MPHYERLGKRPAVTVVVPMHHNGKTIEAQLDALSYQQYEGACEVVVADKSLAIRRSTLLSDSRTASSASASWMRQMFIASATLATLEPGRDAVRRSFSQTPTMWCAQAGLLL